MPSPEVLNRALSYNKSSKKPNIAGKNEENRQVLDQSCLAIFVFREQRVNLLQK